MPYAENQAVIVTGLACRWARGKCWPRKGTASSNWVSVWRRSCVKAVAKV